MKTKKNILRFIAIGSIFIFTGFNFTFLVSLNDSNLSGFWMTHNIKTSINQASAEDDEYAGGGEDYNTNHTTNTIYSSGLLVDGIYMGDGNYTNSKGTKIFTVEITILGGKITSAKWLKFFSSGNGLYTQSMGDLELAKLIKNQAYGINTFSGATGTSNAINNAIINAIDKAKLNKTAPIQITNSNTIGFPYILSDIQKNNLEQQLNVIFIKLENKLSTINFIESLKKTDAKIEVQISNGNSKTKAILEYVRDLISMKISESNSKTFTSPNGNIYKIHQLTTGEYIFKRIDGTLSNIKFNTYSEIRNYLFENTLYKVDSIYTTPNGGKFTIIQNQNDLTYKFKWANGTLGTNIYVSKEILLYNLKINNPAPIIPKKITTKPIIKTAATTTKVTSPIVNPTPITKSSTPTTSTPPVNTNTKAS